MGSSISGDVNKIKESYSKIQDTIEYKKLRVQAIKDWPNNKRFEVENQFLERVERLPGRVTFIPFPFDYLEDNTYNLLLSLFLDALEFLPMRPDLSFDFIWRMIDTYSSEIFPGPSGKERIQQCIEEVWIPMIKKRRRLIESD